jgi:pimeloyl-ACP methyl ester carboxylesterase
VNGREGTSAKLAATASISSTPQRSRGRYDVTHVVDEPGNWFISAEIITPAVAPDAEELTVLCCSPGGGCTGQYFDLGEPGSGFSFAQYAVGSGVACILIDNLATGQSSPDANPWVSPQSVARANAEGFALATEELRSRLPASVRLASVGIGHSMGAMLTLMAQAMIGQHVAVACLGFTPSGLPSVLSPDELHIANAGPVSYDTLLRLARQRFSDSGQPPAEQQTKIPFPFTLPGTDPAGRKALAATATNLLPLPATLSLLPGNVVQYIRQITAPVFIGGGDHEPWHKAAEIVPIFEGSNDISFYSLTNAAHNHNVAPTRELLWQRMLGWAAVVVANHALAH